MTLTVKTHCNVNTSIISLGLSGVGALGAACALRWYIIVLFHDMSKFPIEYPTSILLGVLSPFVFIVLIVLYIKERKKNWSVKGIIIDVLTSILFLPTFFFLFMYLFEIIT